MGSWFLIFSIIISHRRFDSPKWLRSNGFFVTGVMKETVTQGVVLLHRLCFRSPQPIPMAMGLSDSVETVEILASWVQSKASMNPAQSVILVSLELVANIIGAECLIFSSICLLLESNPQTIPCKLTSATFFKASCSTAVRDCASERPPPVLTCCCLLLLSLFFAELTVACHFFLMSCYSRSLNPLIPLTTFVVRSQIFFLSFVTVGLNLLSKTFACSPASFMTIPIYCCLNSESWNSWVQT